MYNARIARHLVVDVDRVVDEGLLASLHDWVTEAQLGVDGPGSWDKLTEGSSHSVVVVLQVAAETHGFQSGPGVDLCGTGGVGSGDWEGVSGGWVVSLELLHGVLLSEEDDTAVGLVSGRSWSLLTVLAGDGVDDCVPDLLVGLAGEDDGPVLLGVEGGGGVLDDGLDDRLDVLDGHVLWQRWVQVVDGSAVGDGVKVDAGRVGHRGKWWNKVFVWWIFQSGQDKKRQETDNWDRRGNMPPLYTENRPSHAFYASPSEIPRNSRPRNSPQKQRTPRYADHVQRTQPLYLHVFAPHARASRHRSAVCAEAVSRLRRETPQQRLLIRSASEKARGPCSTVQYSTVLDSSGHRRLGELCRMIIKRCAWGACSYY